MIEAEEASVEGWEMNEASVSDMVVVIYAS